ncbi:MAG TPA: polysaccharide pyruvyl transferase family protein [Microbacterium sp.]|nr:polysaccharide pyruvyl transferase family protein [Microbacterium sp.]
MTLPIENANSRMSHPEDPIIEMQRRSYTAMSALHRDIDRLVLTDFPDYENIGDSVIALGQAEFWRQAGIRVEATYSWRTIAPKVYESPAPVAIQGGGNFGGLYPQHSEHRYRLAERLDPLIELIQEPQSVHFESDADLRAFASRMAPRRLLRMAVRDRVSLSAVRALVPNVVLAPDSVHMLGRLESSPPSAEVVHLLRRDDESAGPGTIETAVDWPAMTFADRLRQRLSRTLFEGAVTRTMNRSTDRWFADASKRLATGVALLSPGETIITDRLHAMLIGLQMGRRVIAIDNTNGKLTSYAATWFADLDLPLAFAPDLAAATDMV